MSDLHDCICRDCGGSMDELRAENERLQKKLEAEIFVRDKLLGELGHEKELRAENERLRKGRDTMGNLWAKEKEHREKAEAENERLLTEVRALEMQSAGLRDAVDVLCAENERLKAYKGGGKEQERK